MNICLFGITGIPLGKHNVKDPRLDQADKLVEAQKKIHAQVDVVPEKEMATCDAILTSRAALSDLLMKDLEAVETRLTRDPGEAEKAVLQKLAEALKGKFNLLDGIVGAHTCDIGAGLILSWHDFVKSPNFFTLVRRAAHRPRLGRRLF